MTGSLLLVVLGAWVIVQATAGGAPARLGLTESAPAGDTPPADQGVPNQDPSKPYLRDPKGRLY